MSPIQKNTTDRHHPNIQCMQARLPLSTYMGVAHMTLHVVRCPSLGWGRWILLLYTILRSNRHLDITNAPTMSDKQTYPLWRILHDVLATMPKRELHTTSFLTTLIHLTITGDNFAHLSAARYTDSHRRIHVACQIARNHFRGHSAEYTITITLDTTMSCNLWTHIPPPWYWGKDYLQDVQNNIFT